MRHIAIFLVLACVGCKADPPVSKLDKLPELLSEISNKLDRQPAPQVVQQQDLSPLVEELKGVRSDFKAAIPKPTPPQQAPPASPPPVKAAYATNSSDQQVVYYFTQARCEPCARFAVEGSLVRINGRPVEWKPFAQCPASPDVPASAPAFYWQDVAGEWKMLIGWSGVTDFEIRFNRPAVRGVQATPAVWGATSTVWAAPPVMYGPPVVTSVTYSDPIVQPVVRMGLAPVTRPGPLGLFWRTRMEPVLY